MSTILIVGAGPVGLTMAAELARFGQPVRIIDKAPERSQTSKALAIWSRTLELFERSGMAETLVAAGQKVHGMRMHLAGTTVDGPSFDDLPTPYPYGLMVPQSETERLLAVRLESLGLRVEREVELLGLSQDSDGALARLRHKDGREEAFTTPWLIGCDGAHSTVRHALGLHFEGHAEPDDFLLADIRIAGGLPGDQLSAFAHRSGPLVCFPMPGGRFRMLADLGRSDDTRPVPDLAGVQTLLDTRTGLRLTASDPVWIANFRINERLAGEYRQGRVFLAGDAAHVHSPMGGQGMNTGMQDAMNLAWKLALTTEGSLGALGLESYGSERHEIARQVVTATGRLTEALTTTNPAAQAVRNAAMRMLLGLHLVQKPAAMAVSEITIGYAASPLSVAAQRHTSLSAGERLPPARYAGAPPGAGAAPRFVLYAADLARAFDLAERFPHLLEPEPRLPPEGTDLLIVRPDGYVGLAATHHDWDAAAGYLRGLG